MNRTVSSFKIVIFAFAVLSLITLNAGVVFGQAISGNLTGTVVDASGAAVNGATVDAVNTGTNQRVSTTTRGAGEYFFSNLPVGTYNVTATAANFKTTTLQNIPVELNKTGTANVQLQVGTSSTTVEVSGTTPPVDTSTAQLGTNYNEQFSQNLNIATSGGLGAGVLNLSLLSPGVTNANAMGDGVGPSVGGQRPRDNNFTVEGVDNNNKTVTGSLVTVPNDSVEGFTLLQNQFNADFGHSSGGQFNTTVKSGTNTFHGSVYEYFRNKNLDATDNTAVLQGLKSPPRLDNNRFGFTFGGPIIKNKLFFFDNYERQPYGYTALGGPTVQAPTAAGLAAIASDPTVSATNLGIFKQYTPVAPAGSACIQYNGLLPAAEGGTPFGAAFSAPANGICSPGSVEVGDISIVPQAFYNFTNFVQSVDYNISEHDQLRGRFIMNKIDGLDVNAQLPAFYASAPSRFYLVNVSEYHTFTPTVTNEFRAGFNRYSNITPSGNFSYPGLDQFPNVTLFDLGGGLVLGPDGNAPQFTYQNFYQFVDNISWVKGKHTLKFGGEYRWYISPQSFTQRERGDYQWNDTQLYLEDFSPDNFGQRSAGSTTYYGNQKAVYWYANDTWRMTSHLSLNLGVRYEYTTTPTGENRQILNAISNTPSLIVPQVNEPLVFNKPQAPTKNFAPRVGFAYSPGSSGTTSIRAGFGLAYDTLYDNIGILAVPPQIGATHNADPSVITPGFLANGGLSGGGSGITILSAADAKFNTANWIPPHIKDPYSVNWNLGVQHSFGKNYTAEVNYVGTRGNHLSFQDIITLRSVVTPNHFLPTYTQNPGQAALDALPLTLTSMQNEDPFVAAYENAGFVQPFITAFLPAGWSTYHGLQTQLSRRFSNGLTFQAAYTWSHTIDNSTADFHTSDITPRRPQDFQNVGVDKSTSALSRTHRFTLAAVYDLPYFKNGSWLMKNIVGNWEFSPVYTFETGEYATVQSGLDSNLNIDSAGDRGIVNPGGTPGVGSGVTPLTNTAGDTVAYLADNPNAQFIQAGAGALATVGRNTLLTPHTNNWDFSVSKEVNITERVKFKLGAQAFNLFNHPQFIASSNPTTGLGVNDVTGYTSVGSSFKNFVNPSKADFNNPTSVFASNARGMALVAKIIF